MNAQATIDAVQRLLERKQTVPSQLVRELMIDLKAQLALSKAQAKRIAELETKPVQEEAPS